MSRGYSSKRKAKRRQARASAASPPSRRSRRWRQVPLIPVIVIVAIFAAVGILGFGTGSSVSKEQVEQEVTEMLRGIPQSGSLLGSPQAPVTVEVYADLECPTVKLFVENYLPGIILNWVRTGAARLDYRSFKTDTSDEMVFFNQETAALAAGRQDRMWNFILTFVRQQGEPRTDYVTEEFLTGIASEIPGLESAKWQRDRNEARLSKRVALGVHSGRAKGVVATPSVAVAFTEPRADRRDEVASIKSQLEAALKSVFEALWKESNEDFPTIIAPANGTAEGG